MTFNPNIIAQVTERMLKPIDELFDLNKAPPTEAEIAGWRDEFKAHEKRSRTMRWLRYFLLATYLMLVIAVTWLFLVRDDVPYSDALKISVFMEGCFIAFLFYRSSKLRTKFRLEDTDDLDLQDLKVLQQRISQAHPDDVPQYARELIKMKREPVSREYGMIMYELMLQSDVWEKAKVKAELMAANQQ